MNGLPTIWLAARAAGITAYVLLTLSMLAGLTLKSRPFGRRVSGATAMEIHRSVTIAGLAAVGVHGVALAVDRTIDITWFELIVPGLLPYRPVWGAAGVLAGELMLILAVSFRLRKRLGMRAWRTLHMSSFAAFALATLHGIFSGTDSEEPWMRWVYTASIAIVLGGVAFRILTSKARTSPVVRPNTRAESSAPTAVASPTDSSR